MAKKFKELFVLTFLFGTLSGCGFINSSSDTSNSGVQTSSLIIDNSSNTNSSSFVNEKTTFKSYISSLANKIENVPSVDSILSSQGSSNKAKKLLKMAGQHVRDEDGYLDITEPTQAYTEKFATYTGWRPIVVSMYDRALTSAKEIKDRAISTCKYLNFWTKSTNDVKWFRVQYDFTLNQVTAESYRIDKKDVAIKYENEEPVYESKDFIDYYKVSLGYNSNDKLYLNYQRIEAVPDATLSNKIVNQIMLQYIEDETYSYIQQSSSVFYTSWNYYNQQDKVSVYYPKGTVNKVDSDVYIIDIKEEKPSVYQFTRQENYDNRTNELFHWSDIKRVYLDVNDGSSLEFSHEDSENSYNSEYSYFFYNKDGGRMFQGSCLAEGRPFTTTCIVAYFLNGIKSIKTKQVPQLGKTGGEAIIEFDNGKIVHFDENGKAEGELLSIFDCDISGIGETEEETGWIPRLWFNYDSSTTSFKDCLDSYGLSFKENFDIDALFEITSKKGSDKVLNGKSYTDYTNDDIERIVENRKKDLLNYDELIERINEANEDATDLNDVFSQYAISLEGKATINELTINFSNLKLLIPASELLSPTQEYNIDLIAYSENNRFVIEQKKFVYDGNGAIINGFGNYDLSSLNEDGLYQFAIGISNLSSFVTILSDSEGNTIIVEDEDDFNKIEKTFVINTENQVFTVNYNKFITEKEPENPVEQNNNNPVEQGSEPVEQSNSQNPNSSSSIEPSDN